MKLSYSNNAAYSDQERSKPEGVLTTSPQTTPASDAQLWEDFKKGSHTAYALIYNTHAHDLYRYGISLYDDSSFVKDCIHDIFLEIWNSRHKLAEVHSIKFYLLKAIRNKINKEHRKSHIRRLWSSDADFTIEVSPETALILRQGEAQNNRQLQKAIDTLSPRQREAIFLKFYQGLSYEEIASILSITVKGSYKLVGRAIHFLRDKMLVLILSIGFAIFL